jgi:3,4-dihydroxy 2-butanone 4-phosphate synthase/GTP cyclohydrolase II
MNDDGTMARLPDLQLFAAEHGLKIGTIADLIAHRSRTESLVHKVGSRPLQTTHGEFTANAYKDITNGAVHMALVKGHWQASAEVLARVHEPLSVLDALEPNRVMHSWGLDSSLQRIAQEGAGVVVLLNCWPSLTAPRARHTAPNVAAWTCAATVWARKFCATAACKKCVFWEPHAACPA